MTKQNHDLYCRNIEAETPARLWWHLPRDKTIAARALHIDPGDPEAWFALLPFRYHKDRREGEPTRHLILAAYPAPDLAEDWFNVQTVLAWEPSTNKVEAMGNDMPQLVGRLSDDDNSVFSDPLAFFVAWARQRAGYIYARKAQPGYSGAIPDLVPGALIVGDIDRIRWPIHSMPRRFTCQGADPKEINRAILKFAKLPTCAWGAK